MQAPANTTSAARLRAAAALAALLAATCASAVPAGAHADDGQSGATAGVQATLGIPVSNFHFLGTSGDEVWGFGQLKAAQAVVDGRRVPSNPASFGSGSDDVPTVLVVHRPSTGWLVASEVTDQTGQPLRGTGFHAFFVDGAMLLGTASMQPSGAAAVFGSAKVAGFTSAVPGVAVRSPGSGFRFIPAPGATSPDSRIITPAADLLTPIGGDAAPTTTPDGATGSADPTPTITPAPTPAASPSPTPEATGARTSESAATTPPTSAPSPSLAATPEPTPSAAAAADIVAPVGTTPTPTPTPVIEPAPADGDAATAARAVVVPNAQLAAGESFVSVPRQALLAVDEPTGKGGALVGVQSTGSFEESVFHWDGDSWSREPIVLPADVRVGSFRIAAIAGTGLSNAWLLGRASTASGKGLVLFKRGVDGVWRQQSLGSSPFADAAPAGTGVTGIAPLEGRAQVLTATTAGLWIDGSMQQGGQTYPFTIYFDTTTNSVRGAWCDAPVASLCLNRLGAGFDTQAGYRSFAWPTGGTFGQRVITNPLRASRAAGTGDGARLVLVGGAFKRIAGLAAGGPDAAFNAPDEGWLAPASFPTNTGGLPAVHVTASPDPSKVQSWPVPARKPLLAMATEPGHDPGDPNAAAVAVGIDGTIVRYDPGSGWSPDALLNGDGVRQTPELRAVAWPEENRIHAVGGNDMWMYRASTGLWEPDPAAPLDFDGNLLGIAFQPDDPSRGYAVGRDGLILAYGKTWEPMSLPDEVKDADILAVTFAGSRAYAVWRMPDGSRSGVLFNDGAGWQVDAGASALMDSLLAQSQTASANLVTIAGLPDGGVVAAGNNVVVKRDGPSSAWRLTSTPITDNTAVAVAAIREDGALHAVVVAYPSPAGGQYPPVEVVPTRLPGQPPFLLSNVDLPVGGVVLRENAAGGWSDETHGSLPLNAGVSGDDPLRRADPDIVADTDQIYALALAPDGTRGWAVGGAVVRRNADDDVIAQADKRRRRTAAAFRYPANPGDPQPPTGDAPVPLDRPVARLAIGGHAACKYACADSENTSLAADVGMTSALAAAGKVAEQVGGPRAFIYTGTRLEQDKLDDDEAERFAQVATSPTTLPFYATRGKDATADGESPYRSAFAHFPAPFGDGATANGITSPALNPPAAAGQARTYYTFDSDGLYGKVRVIVIDNASGALADASADQRGWLIATLDDAKAQQIPAIVVGNRTLDPAAKGQTPATDAADTAQLLFAHGASAYFYDAPGINVSGRIPAGAPAGSSIPSFGTGTLGYGSQPPANAGLAYYGDGGYLLTEIDTANRDPTTNVAPVNVRLIPVINQVSIDPVDGTLLRRSKVAQFTALGRRPQAGGIDPYTEFPSTYCQVVYCDGRIAPEYQFTSSRPDIANFVQRDTRVSDPKAVYHDASSATVPDSQSGLLCAYNSGTTNLTVAAGGRSFTQTVTVQSGPVSQPCGTVKLAVLPARAQGAAAAAPPPAAAPAGSSPAAPISLVPPPPPPPAAPISPVSPPKPVVAPVASAFVPFVPTLALAPIVPLVPPTIARPLPPPTPPGVPVTQPVTQVEEKREEEEAFESQSAFAQALPADHRRVTNGGLLVLVLVMGAGAGAITRTTRRRPRPGYAEARAYESPHSPYRRR